VNVDPLDGDAALPRERERVRRQLRDRFVDIGVGLDDDRGCIPELERDLFPRRPLP
jgi:hypothetical protein